jgi:hypothetical protein
MATGARQYYLANRANRCVMFVTVEGLGRHVMTVEGLGWSCIRQTVAVADTSHLHACH